MNNKWQIAASGQFMYHNADKETESGVAEINNLPTPSYSNSYKNQLNIKDMIMVLPVEYLLNTQIK